jgi:hypothetical protein
VFIDSIHGFQYASIVNSTPSETLKVAKSKSFRNLADFQLIDSLFHSNSTSSLPQSDAAEPNAALVIPKSDPREVYRTIQSKILTPPTLPSPPPNPFTVKPPIELTPLVLATSASVPAFETKSNHSRPVSAAVSRFSQETPRFGRFGIFTAAPGASAPVPHNEQHVRIGSLLLRLKQPTASTSTAIDQQSRTKLANTIGKSQTISKPEPVQSIISMVSDRLFVCRDVEQEFGWASVGSFQVLEPLPCIPNSETTLKHDNPPVHDTIVAQTNTNSHDQSQKSSPRKATMSVHSGSRVAFNAQSLPDMLPKPRPSTADQLADKARVEELRRQNELRMRKLAERSMSDAQRKEIAREVRVDKLFASIL